MARYTKKDADGRYYIESVNGKLESDKFGHTYGESIDRFAELENADVAPRAEVANEIIFDLACKLHTMLPYKIHPIPIDGKCEGNTYELGKEHVIYDTLKYLNELKKKYTEDGE